MFDAWKCAGPVSASWNITAINHCQKNSSAVLTLDDAADCRQLRLLDGASSRSSRAQLRQHHQLQQRQQVTLQLLQQRRLLRGCRSQQRLNASLQLGPCCHCSSRSQAQTQPLNSPKLQSSIMCAVNSDLGTHGTLDSAAGSLLMLTILQLLTSSTALHAKKHLGQLLNSNKNNMQK